MFPKSDHKFKLNFMGITTVTNTTVDQIPPHVFDFMDFPSILQPKKIDIFIDVIGHVVEKFNIRDKEVNGKKTALLDLVLEDLALMNDDLAVTPTLSQRSGTAGMSIADELLNTPRKCIAELIEATEPFLACVLVDAVEFDMSEGWAFNSCNTCFRTANKVGTAFTCRHCKTLVSATPRYKLNVVVIDETGSTTFTLFNGLVSMIVGRSAVDLITAYSQRGTEAEEPIEFDDMLGKKYLFKVEVSKGNIEKGYTTYTARKFSSESGVIGRFIRKHGMNVCNEEEEDDIFDTIDKLEARTPVIDLGDSSSTFRTEDYLTDFEVTPTSRQLGKRPINDFDGVDVNDIDFSPDSTRKLSRGSIKIEPKE